MPPSDLINRLPLSVFFALCVLMVLASIRSGYFAGQRRRRAKLNEPEEPIGSVVGAMLGLLAFLLAFTFGIAASRFESRKQLLLDEVNAIGTAVLRADLLPEPHRSEVKRLFKRYVDIRVDIIDQPQNTRQLIAESESIQDQIWFHAVNLERADLNSHVGALFIESLNQVFDLHTSRVTVAFQYHIPPSIWLGLMVVTIFSMAAVGYQFGIAGHDSLLIQFALAIAFSAVVLLIADLDRAGEGTLRVSQQPIIELQQKLNVEKK